MLYGAMVRNYTKGNVDIWLYSKRKDAEKCVRICDDIWEKELDDSNYSLIPKPYSDIERVNPRDWQEVNKEIWVSINENGRVHPVLHNIRIVNLCKIPYVA